MDTSTTTSKKKNFKHTPKMRDAARWNISPEQMKTKLKAKKEQQNGE